MTEGRVSAENERRLMLADLIQRKSSEIEERWLERVEAELKDSKKVSRTELKDAMPDYLRRIADALAADGHAAREGSTAWAETARQHALMRSRLGFDIDELVREFVILRQVLFEVTRDEGLEPDARPFPRIADFLEGAISVAVRSYVDARDYAARQREAEHIGFLAHELRNPLSAMKLSVRRIRRDPSPMTQDQIAALAVVERNVDHLVELLDGVLHMERLEAHEFSPHPVDLSLGELLPELVRSAEADADSKGLVLDVQYDADVVIHADARLAASAIGNVLGNAVKYTDFGLIRVIGQVLPDRAVLHVWDNCPGLSAEELEIIFEPFRRGRSQEPGTGSGWRLLAVPSKCKGERSAPTRRRIAGATSGSRCRGPGPREPTAIGSRAHPLPGAPPGRTGGAPPRAVRLTPGCVAIEGSHADE
jgi:signal transduction histidine kinase